MMVGRRVLTSTKKEEKIQFRKPVKECYCNSVSRKNHWSTRTKIEPTPCIHCRNDSEFRPTAWVESNDVQHSIPVTSRLSCEISRRVQNINYSPQSQCLQNKISSSHRNLTGRPSEVFMKPSCQFSHRFPLDAGDRACSEYKQMHTVCRSIDQPDPVEELNQRPEFSKFLAASRKKSVCKPIYSCHSKEVQVDPERGSKESCVSKKTISSKKASSNLREKKSRLKSGQFLLHGYSRSTQSNPTYVGEDEGSFFSEECCGKYDVIPKCSKKPDLSKRESRMSRHQSASQYKRKTIGSEIENSVSELNKFREQNYFDTHGSTQTLLSSRSSGSLERYFLNERLFPQPAGKIHRGDLVVTMPLCATKQRKQVHYFPRYVVKQEQKKEGKSCGKRKYCRSCPLTGHAIDFGIFKSQHPTNSLALRFQKGVP